MIASPPPSRLVMGICLLGLLLLAAGFLTTWNAPLSGIHGVRQADTLFAGWSYCVEGTEFLRPRVAHRGTGAGVAIGEFPLASAVFAAPCLLTGTWSEGAVKLMLTLILALNTLVWGLFIRRRWPDRWPGWAWFGVIWVFSTHSLLHLTIAIPDPLALMLVATAGLAFQSAESSKYSGWKRFLTRAGGIVFFTIAFAIRPYLVPLLLLVISHRKWRGTAFIACTVFYLAWYRWWSSQSDVSYYATDAFSMSETLTHATGILYALAEFLVRNMTNVIGLWFAVLAWRVDRDRFLWGLAFASLAMVLAMRAPMIIHHKYYLGAFSILLTILLTQGARRAPPWTAAAFLLVAVVNVQHLWHGDTHETWMLVQTEIERHAVAPKDRIAVYAGNDSAETRYLYWAKRTGWVFPRASFAGTDHCPEGANWAMIVNDDHPVLQPCTRP